MNNFYNEFLAAKKAAIQAGKIVLLYYKNKGNILIKKGNNPTTKADLASEKIIIENVKHFNYGILSEENNDDKSRLLHKLIWIIDPLDGTKDFIQKTDEFTIMLALVEKGEPVLGLVYQPVKKILFYALKEQGAFLEKNGERPIQLHVSKRDDLHKFRLLISRNHLLKLEITLSKKLQFEKVISCGSAGLKAALIAHDKADLYLNTSNCTFEWDICAADIIVREAGGEVTDMIGNKIKYNKKNPKNIKGFVISNKKRHKDILKQLITCVHAQ